MAHFLKHYFDPDFNHLDVKAKALQGGRVDHLNRDYVHNVVSGELLAEWTEVPDPSADGYDPRFVFQAKSFPAGPNTLIDPHNPDRLLAAVNGYVYYNADKNIAVNTLLNVRRDVDYATGNISFVGDVVVHGGVRSGFSVKGRNILVKGPVEGAVLEAGGSIQVEAGVKGDNQAKIRAKGSVKLGFCENALVSAEKNILVQGSSMHCKLFAGNALAVKERLIGGEAVCRRMVHVQEQLGGGLNTITNIVLGYDPQLLKNISDLKARMATLKNELSRLSTQVARKAPGAVERTADLERKHALYQKQLKVWSNQLLEEDLSACAVIAPGEVRSGVEISIGSLYHSITDVLRDVRIQWKDRQISVASPAEQRK